ncbi:FAD-binding protein [Yinghuangia sp. ASG 101]|uniref:FAD-binding oxidoreductase n=1 Tax=Yinghuangia sp. ASG 101 TaxID=2896848 RepID=UPI001E2CA132|nr:FAD-binding protein [Yinghuangia sp. ASG 101]UGQ11780.1 FAD-binding protein [Yinghuangia sp. ASG 101]
MASHVRPTRRGLIAAVGAAGITAGLGGRATAAPAATGQAGSHRASFGPFTVGPDDPRYAELTTGVNQRWVGRPDAVRLPGTTAHVVQAVQDAVRTGRRISVRGGGHCLADFVYHPDVRVVIDMSGMHAVGWDADMGAFMVEAGATLLNVYDTLYKGWGVTIPGGLCYSVGVGGHVQGGGFGLLSRRHGLTVDHLHAVEVVTVDAGGTARAVVATRDPRDPNHDLWWGHTGGGGGNFGVVTRYWFRSPGARGSDPRALLPVPPREVLVHVMALPWSDLDEAGFTRFVGNVGRWYEANRDPESPYTGLSGSITLSHKSAGTVNIVTQIDADRPDAERMLGDYLNALTDGVGAPARTPADATAPLVKPRRLPWLRATRYLGTVSPDVTAPVQRSAHHSTHMRTGVPDEHVAKMYRHLTLDGYTNRTSMVVVNFMGGRVDAVAPTDTATFQRDSIFKLLYQSVWQDPAEDALHTAWARDFYRDVYAATGGVPVPGEATNGCYINYPDTAAGDADSNTSGVPWASLYYGGNLPRLRQVKARHDPRGIFRHAQSIPTGG